MAAGHELTAQAAGGILREGGNAFDAVLAGHFAACIAEPVLASLGGGGFMLGLPDGGEPVVYDFFVQTPRRKRGRAEQDFRPVIVDFGTAQQEFHIGQGAIATPGTVRGIFAIHRDLGSMPLGDIAELAIRSARAGVTVSPMQAYVLRIVSPIFLATAESCQVFADRDSPNQVLGEGAVLRRPDLAATLEQLIREGDELFYRGEIAEQIVTQCREQGGHLTREDLECYQVIKRKPLVVPYRGSQVVTNPPPSSAGILIALALELLKTVGVPTRFHDTAYPCLLAEAMALTSKARMDAVSESGCRADPLGCLLDTSHLDRYRQEIAHRAQAIRGTTHISVIDSSGNVASMTVSNGEGCGAIVPHTGIMLNNMLGETDINVHGFHSWQENVRLTSMMAPTLIMRPDKSVVATGSGGSNRIRTALLQVIMNLVHFDMDVVRAVTSPRLHLEDEKLSLEGHFTEEQIARLIARYPVHEVWNELNLFFGGVHTVLASDGEFVGVGDPRRSGVACVA